MMSFLFSNHLGNGIPLMILRSVISSVLSPFISNPADHLQRIYYRIPRNRRSGTGKSTLELQHLLVSWSTESLGSLSGP